MTRLAFGRDIAAHLLQARPLQILRPKRNDICQAVCEAHVDISCSQDCICKIKYSLQLDHNSVTKGNITEY
ncbi:hypothetical protein T07_9622 [Trichinella nelsoni]|uniref:Uncharacterized protein n=1 Tax=Trichinella nelsoni TaxID=6336 RepID=A0A0V0RIM4_9BILA|nr:hypothetical protein T07_9622 [Trichinella nelsoni]